MDRRGNGFVDKLEEQRNVNRNPDTVEISEEGKALLKAGTDLDNTVSDETRGNATKEPVTYTKKGEAVSAEQGTSTSISVSV